MDRSEQLVAYLTRHPGEIGKVVDLNPATDRLYKLDFTAANTELSAATIDDAEKFSQWVDDKLATHQCKFGIGGYMEHRTIYNRSTHFNTEDERRRLHLGVDIWGPAGTPVYAGLGGHIHSFADNNNFGDYGPTIILQHDLDGLTLYSLYGHLNRESLYGLQAGQPVKAGHQIAAFGNRYENGSWPPHLHFQLMFDMEGKEGDYPGVCRFSEKDKYIKNIPDPQLILRFPL